MKRLLFHLILCLFCCSMDGCNRDPYRMQLLNDGGWAMDIKFGQDALTQNDQKTSSKSDGSDAGGANADMSMDACLSIQEACNNLDDNCNNQIDEGFDKKNDPRYCENCKGCQSLYQKHAYPKCDDGKCAIAICMDGYVDQDQKSDNGCEYKCTPTGVEICDGIDNDCDKEIDEGVKLSSNICKDIGPCKGAAAKCMGSSGWQCVYGPKVEMQPCSKDAECGADNKCVNKVCPGIVIVDELKCDGEDGDCDGVADDPWSNPVLLTAIGNPCTPDPQKLGICQPQGVYACNSSQDGTVCKQTQPGLSPKDEECNGLDDDCDGKVDESTNDGGYKGVVDAMVEVKGKINGKEKVFYIYAYEASHPDATSKEKGNLSTRACSKAGVLPWSQITYAEAVKACNNAGNGQHLCSDEEWLLACKGQSNTTYPYGNTYEASFCNGVDKGLNLAAPTGSLAKCVGGYLKLFDMSGNLREWTQQKSIGTSGDPPKNVYVVRGGAYHTPSLGLTCEFNFSQAVEDVILPANGFRCCSDTSPL